LYELPPVLAPIVEDLLGRMNKERNGRVLPLRHVTTLAVCPTLDHVSRPLVNAAGMPRLHVVTGKGGAGKTTVAGSLALALASGGKRVLLVEVEGRQGIAHLFDTAPLPYEERRIAVAPGGGDVYALAVDAEAALMDYLEIFYNIKRAGTLLKKVGAVDFATTIAPGLRDVLLTGKAAEAVRRKRSGDLVYDAVVLDAPPSGRVVRFLNVTSEVSGIARVGPIRNHSDMVMSVIRSPQTAVHIVTLLEEMPVQETIDTAADLREHSLPTGMVFVNMTRPSPLRQTDLTAVAKGDFDSAAVSAELMKVGVHQPHETSTALVTEARAFAARTSLEKRERKALKALDMPMVELPLLHEGIDLGGLYDLAEILRPKVAT
jgi:anion-transporting  ArsA/GET3 family ATPase